MYSLVKVSMLGKTECVVPLHRRIKIGTLKAIFKKKCSMGG